jgi:hypothetical protein
VVMRRVPRTTAGCGESFEIDLRHNIVIYRRVDGIRLNWPMTIFETIVEQLW